MRILDLQSRKEISNTKSWSWLCQHRDCSLSAWGKTSQHLEQRDEIWIIFPFALIAPPHAPHPSHTGGGGGGGGGGREAEELRSRSSRFLLSKSAREQRHGRKREQNIWKGRWRKENVSFPLLRSFRSLLAQFIALTRNCSSMLQRSIFVTRITWYSSLHLDASTVFKIFGFNK